MWHVRKADGLESAEQQILKVQLALIEAERLEVKLIAGSIFVRDNKVEVLPTMLANQGLIQVAHKDLGLVPPSGVGDIHTTQHGSVKRVVGLNPQRTAACVAGSFNHDGRCTVAELEILVAPIFNRCNAVGVDREGKKRNVFCA